MEDAYENFGRLLEDHRSSSGSLSSDLDGRDLAVAAFASRLLKRTLSDSFAGVQLGDDHDAPHDHPDDEDEDGKRPLLAGAVASVSADGGKRRHLKLVHIARSMSLELAKHKHRLASQLVSEAMDLPRDSPSIFASIVVHGNFVAIFNYL